MRRFCLALPARIFWSAAAQTATATASWHVFNRAAFSPITHHHTLELDHCQDLTLAVSHNFIAMSGLDPLYYGDKFRLRFQHKLRWWRWVIGSSVHTYIAMAAMHLLSDL